jgi:membrane protein YdbS with pleckstrin-like domain
MNETEEEEVNQLRKKRRAYWQMVVLLVFSLVLLIWAGYRIIRTEGVLHVEDIYPELAVIAFGNIVIAFVAYWRHSLGDET